MGPKIVDVDAIPWIERMLNWFVGLSGIAYGFYCFKLEGDKFLESDGFYALSEGWNWTGRRRDLSDAEWMEYRQYAGLLCLLCSLRVAVIYTLHWLCIGPVVYKALLLVVDSLAIAYLTCVKAVVLLYLQCALMYLVSLTNNTWAVWIMGATLFQSLNNFYILKRKQEYLALLQDFNRFGMFFTAEAFFYLKMVSYCVEKVRFCLHEEKHQLERLSAKPQNKERAENSDREENVEGCTDKQKENDYEIDKGDSCGKEKSLRWRKVEERQDREKESNQNKKEEPTVQGGCDERHERLILDTEFLIRNPTFLDILFYCLSLPLFYDGPVYNFNKFYNQFEMRYKAGPPNLSVALNIGKNLLRIAFWFAFLELQSHWMYHSVLLFFPHYVGKFDLPAVLTMGYYQGIYFMMKYLCMYGMAMQFLRFESIDQHSQPRCTAWVFSFSDNWKHFDEGLYKFIKIYILIPVSSWRRGMINKLFATFVTFTFVFVFHGLRKAFFIWALGNFVITSLEFLASCCEMSPTGLYLKSFLSPAAQVRLRALLITPLYAVSCNIMFFYFFEQATATVMANRMLFQATWSQYFWQALIFYTNIMNAFYIYEKRGCRYQRNWNR